MQKHKILTERRINQVETRIYNAIWSERTALDVSYASSDEPMTFEQMKQQRFRRIEPGTVWGSGFSCAWFRIHGSVPAGFKGKSVVALLDFGGEGCVVNQQGHPVQGITNLNPRATLPLITGKKEVRLFDKVRGNESVSLLVDAGANRIMGASNESRFSEASLALFNRSNWDLYHQYSFLNQLMQTLNDDDRTRALLLRALNDVCNIIDLDDEATSVTALKRLKQELKRPASASSLKVSAIGHAHIDVAWLWPIRETVRKTARTFATALTLMDEYPDYRFGASQPQLYQYVKDHYPRLYRRIKAAVKAGKWEVQGAMWVEADTNIPSGESLVRQLYYGKRFFREEFGIDTNQLWLPDVFGYSAALPQILKKSGVDYFMTQKISWSQFNQFPHHTFIWQGMDGSRVFSHFLPNATYNTPATARSWKDFERNNLDIDRSSHALCLFGIGDGGGGPGRTHIEWTQLARDIDGLPRVEMEFARDFFHKAEADAKDLLTWQGELYLEYHRGTFTTQALVKKMNRQLEQQLREWEWLLTTTGERCPRAELERLWKVVLLNQFHDIIPGSSINRVYNETNAQYKKAADDLERHIDTVSQRYLKQVDTRGFMRPSVVINTLSWSSDRWIRLPGRRSVMTGDGGTVPSQVIRGLADQKENTLVRLNLPSMGHVVVERRGRRSTGPNELKVRSNRMENQLLRIEFLKNGTIGSIYDKQSARAVLSSPGNLLGLYEDRPLAFDAWDVDIFYLEKAPQQLNLVSSEVVEEGPLRVAIEQLWQSPECEIRQRVYLYSDDTMIEFDTVVDWQAEHKMLRVDFPVDIHADRAHFEIQFGHIARNTHDNTSWDMAQFEVVGHRWAELSQPNYGVALLNDCKYGYRVKDGTMSLNLLRSPKSPDSKADMGRHHFRYALLPHRGDHLMANVVQRAAEFNITTRGQDTDRHTGRMPHTHGHFSLDVTHVVIDTVKHAETDKGLILRMYEAEGKDGVCNLSLAGEYSAAFEVDLMEENPEPLKLKGQRQLKLKFTPFEIKTLHLVK